MDISSDKLLRVKLIHLRNGDLLKDKVICFLEGFIIVMDDEEDLNPIWYNKDSIRALQDVECIGTVKDSNKSRLIFL